MNTTKCAFSLFGMMPPCALDKGHAGEHADGFGGFYGNLSVIPIGAPAPKPKPVRRDQVDLNAPDRDDDLSGW